MKRIVCSLVVGLTLLVSSFAQAYTVNGRLDDDWGVTPGLFGSSNWTPNAGVLSFIEDTPPGQNCVGPGYGGQDYDVEAMYFDFKGDTAYMAIVTGFPQTGLSNSTAPLGYFYPGDIAFDFGRDDTYEYGIRTSSNSGYGGIGSIGEVYQVDNWWHAYEGTIHEGVWVGESDPTVIKAGTKIGSANLIYNNLYSTDNGKYHYVIEASIPLSLFGNSWSQPSQMHWTMTCGNDYINLDIPAPPVSAPEPGTMILFCTGIFGILATSFRRFFKQIKRGMDIVMAGLALVLTAPLWLVIAIAIKLTSKGPVFFNQERVGENKRYSERRQENRSADRRAGATYGKSFIMYKFRTMKIDAEKETGAVWAQENDPRIIPLGRFLRKSHLDELPQLVNVLKGEMSMIGPRPERAQIIPTLNKSIKKYSKRLRVKPGITGLAQVRQHYDSTLRDVKKKVHYDLLYIRKMCLLMDLRIIFGTFVVMLTGKGAR